MDAWMKDLSELRDRLREFAAVRDWDQFHAPKNLAMALIVECAELVEHFQWLKEEASYNLPPDTAREVEMELADILIYLVRLADKLGVDLMDAAQRKIEVNERKYPVDRARGRSDKYHRYTE
jgi:NTP pyrophosphatase (non-canonical NTP hydrolase)